MSRHTRHIRTHRAVVGVIGSGQVMRQASADMTIAPVGVVESAQALAQAFTQSVDLSDLIRSEEWTPKDPRPYYRRFEKRGRKKGPY